MVYLQFEDEYRRADQVTEGTQYIALSGTDIRRRVREGRRIPEWATFPEVIEELQKAYPPPNRQGFTVFMTGLSGAGKSTIAKILYSKFLERGDRPVTLLDGDIVRHNLSSELSFSKEHRDINVKRIGFVASEITKNRGLPSAHPLRLTPIPALKSAARSKPTADSSRHVATPRGMRAARPQRHVCQGPGRPDQGLHRYRRPYEDPRHPEVRIDTTHITPDEAPRRFCCTWGRRVSYEHPRYRRCRLHRRPLLQRAARPVVTTPSCPVVLHNLQRTPEHIGGASSSRATPAARNSSTLLYAFHNQCGHALRRLYRGGRIGGGPQKYYANNVAGTLQLLQRWSATDPLFRVLLVGGSIRQPRMCPSTKSTPPALSTLTAGPNSWWKPCGGLRAGLWPALDGSALFQRRGGRRGG
jgi:adenylylsulfate kinase-like enzyme